MSKLLARAKVKLFNAKNDYRNVSLDDAYIDDCCYNLQQCIEFGLKFIVEMNGENYVENHDVRAQINKLKTIGVTLPFENEIRILASTLNSWEAESRYKDDFTALGEDIEDAMKLAEKIVDYCEGLIS